MNADLQSLVAANDAEVDHTSPAAIVRRHVVLALRAQGLLRGPAEQFAAATVLIYSEDLAEVEAAQALALAAMGKDKSARRLAATAYDRLRRLRGEPQKFGTQLVVRGDVLELWPIDPATTDSERAKWDVPPLAEIQRRLAEVANGPPGPRT